MLQSALTPGYFNPIDSHCGENRIKTDIYSLMPGAKTTPSISIPNPSVIVFPSSTEQVPAMLKFANGRNIAITPSGGRTGLSAGAVSAANGEIVVSMDKMNQILGILPRQTVWCVYERVW